MKRVWYYGLLLLFCVAIGAGILPADEMKKLEISKNAILNGNGAAALYLQDGSIYWDSALAQSDEFHWGAVEFPVALVGDFIVEADCRLSRLDHWNGMRLNIHALQGDWNALLSRTVEQPGTGFLTAAMKSGDKEDNRKIEMAALDYTLRIRREGGSITYSWIDAEGNENQVAEFKTNFLGAVKMTINFDSPANTVQKCNVTGVRYECSSQLPGAFLPSYTPFQKVCSPEVIYTENAAVNDDGTYDIQPGGRLILASQSAPSAHSWLLKWKSEGPVKIRSMLIGSKETLQLSDSIVWDDIDCTWPDGFAERVADVGTYVKRFNGDRGWPLANITVSGLFFWEVSPAQDKPVHFGFPALWAHEVIMPEPLENLPVIETHVAEQENNGGYLPLKWAVPGKEARFFQDAEMPPKTNFESDGVPFVVNYTMLSPSMPAVEFTINRTVGTVEIFQAGGRQPNGFSELAAGYLLVYEDGTTMPAFATFRWNCGVFSDGWLPTAGQPDYTWWGPPRFGWASVAYLPKAPYGICWNSFYHSKIVNPNPEKTVRCLQIFQYPGDTRDYLIAGLTLRTVEETVIGLVEPDRATFDDGEELGVNYYEYRAVPREQIKETLPLFMAKDEENCQQYGEISISRNGRFGACRSVIIPDAKQLDAGPVRLVCGGISSSRLGFMGKVSEDDKPFYYTMICSGRDGMGDLNRISRLGYNAIKLHIGWELNEKGEPDFEEWPERFERAGRAGLHIAIRNLFVLPKQYKELIPPPIAWTKGEEKAFDDVFVHDVNSPIYREKLVDYYHRVGKLAAAYPWVMGINANYGQVSKIGVPCPDGTLVYSQSGIESFREYLKINCSLEDINRKAHLALASFDDVTISTIGNDTTRTFLPLYSRWNEGRAEELITNIAKGIRSAGCKAHLTFNVNFHPIEDKLIGSSFGAYLRVGMNYGPGSLFHETSERYTLSFVKWLAAARTCGLLYGDECCQPPPTYEHLMFAYMWMGMMQCYESNYCQWWGGRPATQNIAQIKPWHKLMINADYLPDPVCLSLSLQTGHDETPDTIKVNLHTQPQSHYGLGNLLRELNINSDRYMIDEFPELDANVKTHLLIDDNTRAMPGDFADRIEAFIRNGGVYLASFETDKLNDYAFFKRFGIEDVKSIHGTGVVPVAEFAAGKGKLVILCGNFANGWDPGRPEAQRRFFYDLLTSLGQFSPLVSSSFADVFATPYRAKNGDLLVSCINITAMPRTVKIGFRADLVPEGEFTVRDLGTGEFLKPERNGDKYYVTTTVSEINTTMIRVSVN